MSILSWQGLSITRVKTLDLDKNEHEQWRINHEASTDKFSRLLLIFLLARSMLLFCNIGSKYVLY